MAGFHTGASRAVFNERPRAPVVDIALVRPRRAEPFRRADATTIRGKRQGLFVTAPMEKRMRELRAKGWSLHQIAAEVGATHFTVHYHTRDVPPPAGGWTRGGQIPVFSADEAARLRRAGLSYRAIAKRMGCSYACAYDLLRRSERKRTRGSAPQVTIRVQAIARWSGFTCAELRAPRNGMPKKGSALLSKARAILFWVLRAADGMNFAAIGRALGGFHDSTVGDGFHRTERAIALLGLSVPEHPAHLVRPLWNADWSSVPCAR